MNSKKLISNSFATILVLLTGIILGQPSEGFSQGGFLIDNGAQVVVEGDVSIVITDGKWQNDGVFAAGTGLVRLEGNASTANSTIGGLSLAGNFYNLTLDKASNAAQLVSDIGVNNQLTLTNGPLNLNGNRLSLMRGDADAISRTSGYLISEQPDNSSSVAWRIGAATGEHSIPFGSVSGAFIPVKITVTSGNVDTMVVSTYPTNAANQPFPITPTFVTNLLNDAGNDNSAFTVDRFWEVNSTGSTGVISLTLTAQASEVGSITNLTAQRWDSVSKTWDAPQPGQISNPLSVTVPLVSKFSTFALTQDIEPLRVDFLSFDADVNGSIVVLKWVTGSEINSDHFSVQRSVDGYSFTEIGSELAAGNSYLRLRYSTEDLRPLQGRSFYRIVEYDIDGKTVTTELRAIYFETQKSISYWLYPNPATQGNLHLRILGGAGENVTVRLVDILGRVLTVEELHLDSDLAEHSFEIIPLLAKGSYFVWITNQQGNQSFRILVE